MTRYIGRDTNKHGLSRSMRDGDEQEGVPDFVHCVLDEYRDHHPDDCKDKKGCERCNRSQKKSWCGKVLFGFHFVDEPHAIHHARSEGRLLVCADCAKAIALTLLGHTWPDLTGTIEIPKKAYEP